MCSSIVSLGPCPENCIDASFKTTRSSSTDSSQTASTRTSIECEQSKFSIRQDIVTNWHRAGSPFCPIIEVFACHGMTSHGNLYCHIIVILSTAHNHHLSEFTIQWSVER